LRSYFQIKIAAPVLKSENTAVGIFHADHVSFLYLQKWALTSLTSGGRSVGIIRSRSQATEFFNSILRLSVRVSAAKCCLLHLEYL
jgi:hypothetical protein